MGKPTKEHTKNIKDALAKLRFPPAMGYNAKRLRKCLMDAMVAQDQTASHGTAVKGADMGLQDSHIHKVVDAVLSLKLPADMSAREQWKTRQALVNTVFEHEELIPAYMQKEGDRCPNCKAGHVRAVNDHLGNFHCCNCGAGSQCSFKGPAEKELSDSDRDDFCAYSECEECKKPLTDQDKRILNMDKSQGK